MSAVGARAAGLRAGVVAHATGLGGLLAAVSLTEFTVRVLLPALAQPHWPGYWAAARFALDGRTDVLYADAAAFGAAAATYGSVPDIFNTNAPTTLLPFLPLGLLPEATAHTAWILMSLVAFAFAWVWLVRGLGAPVPVVLAATALVAQYRPLREDVGRGQAYLLLFALLTTAAVLAARSSRGRAVLVAGLALAGAAILKLPYGLAVLAGAAIARRTAAVGVAIATLVAAVGVTLVIWGPELWSAFATHAAAWRTRPEIGVTAFQTVNGFLAHLFRFDPMWNPGPIVDAPWLVTPLWAVAATAMVGATAVAIRRGAKPKGPATPRSVLPVAVVLAAAPVLAPIAEQYHYTPALLTLVVLAAIFAREGARLRWWVALAASVALLGGPWQYNVARVEGWSALLHYPRLYGGLILWTVACAVATQSRTAASARLGDGRSKGAGFGRQAAPEGLPARDQRFWARNFITSSSRNRRSPRLQTR